MLKNCLSILLCCCSFLSFADSLSLQGASNAYPTLSLTVDSLEGAESLSERIDYRLPKVSGSPEFYLVTMPHSSACLAATFDKLLGSVVVLEVSLPALISSNADSGVLASNQKEWLFEFPQNTEACGSSLFRLHAPALDEYLAQWNRIEETLEGCCQGRRKGQIFTVLHRQSYTYSLLPISPDSQSAQAFWRSYYRQADN